MAYVIGGMVLFLYGMRLASGGLREAAGGYLKAVLAVLTTHRTTGVLAGVGVTFLLSSSSAVSVLLVDLANVGLISLPQAILVLMGSTIGTALTVQIITFRVAQHALFVVAAGFLINIIARYRRSKAVGTALIGLGLLFFGLGLVNQGVGDNVKDWLEPMKPWLAIPIVAFLFGLLMSAAVRSAATVGFAVVLAGNGVEVEHLVPVVLGAGVGTCSAVMLAAVMGGRKGKQVAVADLLFRLVIAVVFMRLVKPTTDFVMWLTPHLTSEVADNGIARRAVANVQMFTCIVTTAAVIPFVGFLSMVVRKIVGKPREIPHGSLQFISFEKDLPTETVLTQAHREVMRMADITLGLVERSVKAVVENNERELERVEAADEKVDVVDEVLSRYLQRLKLDEMSNDELEVKSKLLYVIKDLEAIADLATRDLTRIGWEKARDNVEFDDDEKKDIEGVLEVVNKDLENFLQTVKGKDTSEWLRAEVLERDRAMDVERMRLFDRQFARVASGSPGAEGSSAAYMNTVNTLRMIHFLISDMVKMISQRPPGRSTGKRPDSAEA